MTLTPSYLVWVALIVTLWNAFSLFFACVHQLRYVEQSFLWNHYEKINYRKAERLTMQVFFFVGVLAQYLFVRFLA